MSRTRVKDLLNHTGEDVTLKGWLYNRRSSKKFHFVLLRDGSGIVQCIVTKAEMDEEAFEAIGKIPYESAIEIRGKANADERSPGGVEIHASAVEVISEAEEYPISKQEHGPDFLLSHRHLWLRSKKQVAIMHIPVSYTHLTLPTTPYV